jgi:hypothetical protein
VTSLPRGEHTLASRCGPNNRRATPPPGGRTRSAIDTHGPGADRRAAAATRLAQQRGRRARSCGDRRAALPSLARLTGADRLRTAAAIRQRHATASAKKPRSLTAYPLPRRGRRGQRVGRDRRGQGRHDRPAPAVTCAPDTAAGWTCTATASDAVSGVSGLAYSVDGAAPVAIASGGTFTVAKGSVDGLRVRRAGNGAASKPVTLADRSTPAPSRPRGPHESRPPAQGRRRRRAPGRPARDRVAADSTTVDLRPLAIGKGSFQFVFKITTGRRPRRSPRPRRSRPATRRGSASAARLAEGLGDALGQAQAGKRLVDVRHRRAKL